MASHHDETVASMYPRNQEGLIAGCSVFLYVAPAMFLQLLSSVVRYRYDVMERECADIP